MKTPLELKYSKSHEWVKITGEHECEVGITDYAQDSLGDLVFVNLPEIDTDAVKDEAICDVESVKAVSDIFSPVSGKVAEVNEELLDAPEKINEDPYGAWLFRLTEVEDFEGLLSAEEYEKVVEEEAH